MLIFNIGNGEAMILRSKGGITIETSDKDKIKTLMNRGFVSIYEDTSPLKGKKKGSTPKRSTKGMKGKRYT
ncbi:hypothetical protein ACFL2A_00595 [Thermodesulfobacteriota bacterium]